MKKACRLSPCSLAALLLAVMPAALGQSVNITSSPNVVGSGARALGMGGAFIAVADDATAASWNPGGLTQLERPEISLVYDFKWDREDFSSGIHPEMDGPHSLSLSGINYLSAVYPIPWTLGGRNFVVSLNYQRKYDFDRQLRLRYRDATPLALGNIASLFADIDYRQEGQLGALSPAFGFEITDKLSVGMVLNFWHESLMPENEWKSVVEERRSFLINGGYLPASWLSFRMEERYKNFRGFSYTLGALYKPDDRWSFGLVYHSKFTGDVDYERSQEVRVGGVPGRFITQTRHKEITFPSAVGAGAAYRFPNDKLTLTMDITRREWDQFVIHDPRNRDPRMRKVSGVSGLPDGTHDVDATWTVRMGAEYVFVNERKPVQNLLPSLRAGLFYDPEPASGRKDSFFGLRRGGDGSPDDYFGVALGAGLLIGNRVNLDLAYIYRWGNDVRKDTFGFAQTSADVDQHAVYISTVIYF